MNAFFIHVRLWLRERATMLRYTYIASRVSFPVLLHHRASTAAPSLFASESATKKCVL